MNLKEFNEKTEKLSYDWENAYTSPDFQCDQTGGFPVSLCVNWKEHKAWLELNHWIGTDMTEEEIEKYEQMCADYGIKNCYDEEQFNDILRELGEEAIQNAELFSEN